MSLRILHKLKYAPVLGVFICLLFYSCIPEAEKTNQPIVEKESKDTLKPIKVHKPEKRRLVIDYRIDSLKTKAELDTFNSRFSEEQRKVIYALNRVDPYRVRVNSALIIPDTISQNLMTYSPFPEDLELLDSLPKALLISQRVQAFALYENGKLLRWGPVSSGKRSTPTPNGLHYANYKAKRKISTINGSWVMPYYFNFMNFEGVGTHQYTLPGFPASHACVRMYREDAKYIYDWASMWQLDGHEIMKNGTPFMVFGEYDFDKPSPWFRLSQDMKANDLNEEELKMIREYVQNYMADPRNFEQPVEEEELSIT